MALLVAVSRGADLIRNADTTLPRKALSQLSVKTEFLNGILQATTNFSAIRGCFSVVVNGLNLRAAA